MIKKSGQQLYKALLQLDYGKIDAGEQTLREIIDVDAIDFEDKINQTKAFCCLGEILFKQGKNNEAKVYLEKVGTTSIDDPRFDEDILSEEKKIAENILKQIG